MSTPDPIEIRTRGHKITGWTSASVEAGIEDLARTFSVGLSGFYASTGNQQLVVGDAVEVRIGGDLVVTGYAETVDDNVDAESEGVTISGRSKTCDIVDCSAPLGTWSKLTMASLFERLTDGMGVDLVDEAGVSSLPIGRHRTEPGESVFDVLDRHARELGCLLTDDAQGRVVLTRAGLAGRVSSPIVQGAGVVSSTGGWSIAERFSRYEVSGQSVQDADVEVDGFGAADDPGVNRFRRLIVVPEKPVSKAQALKRARWEAVSRAGKSFAATYILRGCRHLGDTGPLWVHNQIVPVVDGRRGIFGSDLLVTKVALGLDENGRKATVSVAPREGFDVYATGVALEGAGVGRWFTTEAAIDLGRRAR